MRTLGTALPMLVALMVAVAAGQEDLLEVATSLRGVRGRVVIPAQLEFDERVGGRVLAALDNQRPLAGLPASVLAYLPITITIVPSPYPELDAWSFERSAVIALPAERVVTWTEQELHRVIRHELAHIGLGRYLDGVQLPVWFREGFAEWAAGRLPCRQKVRLQMNVALQQQRDEVPELDASSSRPSRRDYDLFASFFEFLEEKVPKVVRSGTLLAEVKGHGVSVGFQRALGRNVVELEREWQAYLDEYAKGEIPGCH